MLASRAFGDIGLATLLALPIGIYALGFGSERPAEGTADEEAVAATIEAVFEATERSDFAALDSLYAGSELTVIEGAGINRGWADYRDDHLKPELKDFRSFVYRPFEIEAQAAGEFAWAIFRYDLKVELEDRSVDNVGRGTAILVRRDGRWIVRHMQTASRPRR
jgi:ketosteroid isomerase-like protein